MENEQERYRLDHVYRMAVFSRESDKENVKETVPGENKAKHSKSKRQNKGTTKINRVLELAIGKVRLNT